MALILCLLSGCAWLATLLILWRVADEGRRSRLVWWGIAPTASLEVASGAVILFNVV